MVNNNKSKKPPAQTETKVKAEDQTVRVIVKMFTAVCAYLVFVAIAMMLFPYKPPVQKLVTTVHLYDKLEIPISKSDNGCANPFQDAAVTATFTPSGGNPVTVKGFFDGKVGSNNTWKIRFAPQEKGEWAYTWNLTGSCRTGNGSDTFTVDNAANNHGFLETSGKHFQFSDGTSFFPIGKSAFALAKDPEATEPDGQETDPLPPFWQQFVDQSINNGINMFRVWLNFRSEEWPGDDPDKNGNRAGQVYNRYFEDYDNEEDGYVWGSIWPFNDGVYEHTRAGEEAERADTDGYSTYYLELFQTLENRIEWIKDNYPTEPINIEVTVSHYYIPKIWGEILGDDIPNQKYANSLVWEKKYWDYVMARLGAYSNVTFEIMNEYKDVYNDNGGNIYDQYVPEDWSFDTEAAWVNAIGTYVEEQDTYYNHLLGVSLGNNDVLEFADEDWMDLDPSHQPRCGANQQGNPADPGTCSDATPNDDYDGMWWYERLYYVFSDPAYLGGTSKPTIWDEFPNSYRHNCEDHAGYICDWGGLDKDESNNHFRIAFWNSAMASSYFTYHNSDALMAFYLNNTYTPDRAGEDDINNFKSFFLNLVDNYQNLSRVMDDDDTGLSSIVTSAPRQEVLGKQQIFVHTLADTAREYVLYISDMNGGSHGSDPLTVNLPQNSEYEYEATYYDPNTGDIIGYQKDLETGGSRTLSLPTYTYDLAILITNANPPDNQIAVENMIDLSNVSPTSGNGTAPDVAVDSEGNSHVAWLNNSGSVYYIKGTDNGDGSITWGTKQQIPNTSPASQDKALDIYIGPDDLPYIAWGKKIDNDNIFHVLKQSSNGSWSEIQAPDVGDTIRDFRIVVNSAGKIQIAYRKIADKERVFYREKPSFNSGNWSAETQVSWSGDGNDSKDPQMALDKDDNLHFVWRHKVAQCTGGGLYKGRYRVKDATTGNWNPDLSVDGEDVSSNDDNNCNGELNSARENVSVAVNRLPGLETRPQAGWTSRDLNTGTVSTRYNLRDGVNGNDPWEEPTVTADNEPTDKTISNLALDSTGMQYLAWENRFIAYLNGSWTNSSTFDDKANRLMTDVVGGINKAHVVYVYSNDTGGGHVKYLTLNYTSGGGPGDNPPIAYIDLPIESDPYPSYPAGTAIEYQGHDEDPDGDIDTREWFLDKMNDGQPKWKIGDGLSGEYTIEEPETYKFHYKVTDRKDNSDEVWRYFTVTEPDQDLTIETTISDAVVEQGGTLNLDITVTNNSNGFVRGKFWYYFVERGGTPSGEPVYLSSTFELYPNFNHNFPRSEYINLEPGFYDVVSRVGTDYPVSVHEDQDPFMVIGTQIAKDIVQLNTNQPPPEYVYIHFGAETAELTPPMRISVYGTDEEELSSNEEGQALGVGKQYIQVPYDENTPACDPSIECGGLARYSFTIPEGKGGKYVIWGRVFAPELNRDSFWLRVDNGTNILWDTLQTNVTSEWTWNAVSHRGTGSGKNPQFNPYEFVLTPGTHHLNISGRDDGTGLDDLLITNNLTLGGE